MTRSDPEATLIGRLDVAIITIDATIDVAVEMMVAVRIGGVMSNNRRTVATSGTYLLHRRQATPTAPSSRPRGLST
jgi:hypothetical protein